MKTRNFLLMSVFIMLLISGTAWAENRIGLSDDSPAILASLDKTGVAYLDESSTAAIRGQADPVIYPKYVLVKVLGLNTLDWGRGVKWTLNPLGYRYGYFGGYNWSNPGEIPVDGVNGMDALFEQHDNASINDSELLAGLLSLPNDPGTYWGNIYFSEPTGAPSSVKVFGVSLIGQKFFFGWKSMPYTEYSRREAVYGIKALIFGKSLFPSLKF